MDHRSRAGAVQWHAARLVAALSLVSLGSACKKEVPKQEPQAAPAAAPSPTVAPAANAKAAAAKPPAAPVKLLEWDDPPTWKRIKPSSSMRYRSYEIPPAKGDKAAAELNVFLLGGDIESNIKRWVDEFSGFDPKTLVRHDRTVNDMTQAVVEVPKGRFSGGMGTATANDNYALLGAIVVHPTGQKYFFKMTGPAATVKAAREPFYSMLDGMRLEGSPAAPPAGAKSTGASKPEEPAKAQAPKSAHPANAAPAQPAASPHPAQAATPTHGATPSSATPSSATPSSATPSSVSPPPAAPSPAQK